MAIVTPTQTQTVVGYPFHLAKGAKAAQNDFLVFGSDDALENVAHANCLVLATNCASRSRAAPLPITSKAVSTPSASDSA